MSVSQQHRLYHLLQLAAHRLKVQLDSAGLATEGITAAQAAVMFAIEREEGSTQRSVALALNIQESAVTAMVARLKKAGLVSRVKNPDDKRSWALSLTPRGRAALEQSRRVLGGMNRKLDKALGADGAKELAGALRRILEIKL